MKRSILSAAFATVLAASGASAQDATYMDMSQVQQGDTVYMGITEANTADGSAFAAGMTVNAPYGNALVIDATVNRIEKEEVFAETNAEGSLISSEDSIEKTIGASGTVNIGNTIENVDDIDGSDIDVEGNSSSVDL